MSGNIEHRLLNEVLRGRVFSPCVQLGLKAEHMSDVEAREIYEYIWGHFHNRDTYKQVPLLSDIKERWPSFQITAVDGDENALPTLIKSVKFTALGNNMKELAEDFNRLVEQDPIEALKIIRDQVANVGRLWEGRGGMGVSEIAAEARRLYAAAKVGTATGVPYPWECLNDDTLGKHPGDLVVIYGRMKSMKTWIMLLNVVNDFENNRRVFLWSREMDKKKLAMRIAAIMARVDYQCFKKGILPRPLELRALEKLRELEQVMALPAGGELTDSDTRSLIVLCGRDAPRTVSEIRAAIELHKPDIAYIDSFYHAESERATKRTQLNERIMYLAQDFKDVALEAEIPVILSGQANRDGEKMVGESLVDVFGSDSLAQEADLILRIVRKKGRELHEEDYEKYWENEATNSSRQVTNHGRPVEAPAVAASRGNGKPPMMKLSLSPKVRAAQSAVPRKIVQAAQDAQAAGRDPGLTTVPSRYFAEICIMLGGNREGVMDGFMIKLIPGYCNEVLKPNITHQEVKAWLKDSGDDDGTGTGKKRRREEKPIPRDSLKGFKLKG